MLKSIKKIGSGRMGEWLPDAKITYYDSIIPNDFHDGYYEGDFTEPNVGESVNVEIEHTDFNFTGSVDYPNEVTITSPTLSQYNSFINDNASEIVITWDEVVPNPDSLEVFIPGIDTIENEEVRITLPGNATSHTIPAGILDFRGFVVTVCISSLNRMDFDTEVYDEESNFELLNISRVFIKAN